MRGLRGKDRFLCSAFALYLEELDMAYREELMPSDLKDLTRLVSAIESERNVALDAASAFSVGADILLLLEDVLRTARDERQELKSWVRWGPSYQKWRDEDGAVSHNFHFRVLKSGWKRWFGAGFMFKPGDSRIYWVVQGDIGLGEPPYVQHRLGKVCMKGHLDQERMLKSFLDGLDKSGLLSTRTRATR
jgi:hypothetical protein